MCDRASKRRLVITLAGIVALSACADTATSPYDVDVQFAKGGGGPSVEAAQPSTAPQEITLDVRVIGSGFDNGSQVKFLKGGQSTPKIVTNHSTYVDRNTMIANITIAVDADVALYDIEVTTSRGKKGMGSEIFAVEQKGTTSGPVYEMSMFPNPDAGISDISDNDVLVGGTDDGPALFDMSGTATLLPDIGGGSATSISPNALYATGVTTYGEEFMRKGFVWDLGSMTATEVVPAAGYPDLQLDDITDEGLAAGQVRDLASSQRPAVWERDGLGTWQPKLLSLLPGHLEGYARGANSAGFVAGRSYLSGSAGHAVLWRLQSDGSMDILDLTPDQDGTGDTAAWWVSELASDGSFDVFGYEAIAGQLGAMVWTVDAAGMVVVNTRRSSTAFRPGDMHANGDVLGGGGLWDMSDNVFRELPVSGSNCSRGTTAFDSSGRVFGWSDVSTKQGSNCGFNGRGYDRFPVIWTKVGG